MIRFLRHFRLLALLLLPATPAVGGAWLQALHPCPVDTPWLSGHGEHEHAPGHAPEACHCIGACAAAGIAVVPPPLQSFTAPVSTPEPTREFVAATGATPLRPSDRLPPSTAPPLG